MLELIRQAEKEPATARPPSSSVGAEQIGQDGQDGQNGQWETRTRLALRTEGERLEGELKSYRNNLIKESIRVGFFGLFLYVWDVYCCTALATAPFLPHLFYTTPVLPPQISFHHPLTSQMGHEDLGQFYYDTGDYAASFKSFSQMREYCVTPKQISEMTLNLVLVAIAQSNWMAVSANVFKLPSLQLKPDEKTRLEPIIMPLRGLVSLATAAFREAASLFLAADPAFITMEPVAGIAFNKQVLTGNDVAVYGGLCALATMGRAELQKEVIDNTNFRNFIELESHIRRMINAFCGAKYEQCLAILEAYRADYLLDVYLQPHVARLYGMIRRKSIVAYFMPFSRASMASMAQTFGIGEEEMERECLEMIRDGSLSARVDPVDGELIAKESDARTEVLQRALDMAEKQEKALRLKIFRINMQAAGFEVKTPKGVEKKEKGGVFGRFMQH